jgi:DNA-binding transcriptional MerR regulator|tara:strand:- start:177 stop:1085 length:909 start_codon:yes stop_codon:yes gene_type:complete
MNITNSQILLDKSIEVLLKCDDFQLVLNEIEQKNYKLSDIGISTRVVSNWRKSNLLFKEDDKNSKNSMARFNLSEIFWLKTIEKMRNFGVPLSEIYTLKQLIEKDNAFEIVDNNIDELSKILKKQNPKDLKTIEEYISFVRENGIKSVFKATLTSFDILLLIALLTRSNSGIFITEDGESMLWTENLQEYIPSMAEYIYSTHIFISFNKILAELGLKQELRNNNNIYSEEEKEIINQIRGEKVVSVKVIFKHQKPKSTQVEYTVDDKLNMVDLYLKHSKDEIKLSPKNGNKRKVIITKHNKL